MSNHKDKDPGIVFGRHLPVSCLHVYTVSTCFDLPMPRRTLPWHRGGVAAMMFFDIIILLPYLAWFPEAHLDG